MNDGQREDLKRKTGTYLNCYMTSAEKRAGFSVKDVAYFIAMKGTPSSITKVPLYEITTQLLNNLEAEGYSFFKGLYFQPGSHLPKLNLSHYQDLHILIGNSQ